MTNKENKHTKLDFSMIKSVRVPHEQFVAIKSNARYVIIEDRSKGDCISFERCKEKTSDNSNNETAEVKNCLKKLKEITEKRLHLVKKLNGIYLDKDEENG